MEWNKFPSKLNVSIVYKPCFLKVLNNSIKQLSSKFVSIEFQRFKNRSIYKTNQELIIERDSLSQKNGEVQEVPPSDYYLNHTSQGFLHTIQIEFFQALQPTFCNAVRQGLTPFSVKLIIYPNKHFNRECIQERLSTSNWGIPRYTSVSQKRDTWGLFHRWSTHDQ